MTTSLPHVQSGKLRALAIAGAERSAKLPDIPTVVEAGYPKLQAPFWLGVVAPAGTPPDIIDKLNAAFRESLAPRRRARGSPTLGAEIKIGTPAEFDKMLDDELTKWTASSRPPISRWNEVSSDLRAPRCIKQAEIHHHVPS